MKQITLFFALIAITSISYTQDLTQVIRGRIIDKNTEQPIPGVNIIIQNTDPLIGGISDENGYFKLEKVPVGRINIAFSFLGYLPMNLNGMMLRSGKEMVVNIAMEENIIQTSEVKVVAYKKDQPLNEMASVSARSFTVEETEKYAGSWGDPARMALNFAGVSNGSDQVNDIIIRGNSPSGLLWRLEGINIPNPNHYGALGTTGGTVSMLNNNVLDNSDFYTGAFPAELGNAISGAFDLSMRSGNTDKREFMGQVGFNGFELGAEGPFVKSSKASYIANFRYSTMGFLEDIGLDMGIGAIPYYQDLSFKIDVPGTTFGRFTIFGLGGLSNILFNDEIGDTSIARTDFTSDMGVIGMSHTYFLSKNSRIKTNISLSGTRTTTEASLYKFNRMKSFYGNESYETKYSVSTNWKKKINVKNTLQAGVVYDYVQVNFLDSNYLEDYNMFINIVDINDDLGILQSFAQWKYRINNNLTLFTGIHHQYSTLNNENSIEPRISAQFQLSPRNSFRVGYGLHSQMQPRLVLFTKLLTDTINEVYNDENKNLKFTKSHHYVLGYDYRITDIARLKVETYYQSLFNVPIEMVPSYISILNYGNTYGGLVYENQLVNKGTGQNFGLELTLERFLSNNYYFLTTISLFESRYKGSNGVERSTAFNGNYTFNVLGGYEFRIKDKNSLLVDMKVVFAGGLPTLPIDLETSRASGQAVYNYEDAYKIKSDDYFRIDCRISYKVNHKKYSEEYALDITNLTNHKNFFMEYYNSDTEEIEEVTKMGIMPMLMYRVNF